MTTLREAAQQALAYMDSVGQQDMHPEEWAVAEALRAALEQPERTLTDEVIADLWHQNGGFHHHFARAVERWLKEKNDA